MNLFSFHITFLLFLSFYIVLCKLISLASFDALLMCNQSQESAFVCIDNSGRQMKRWTVTELKNRLALAARESETAYCNLEAYFALPVLS